MLRARSHRLGFVFGLLSIGMVLSHTRLVRGDTGDVLAEYLSASYVLPQVVGWEHEGDCLSTDCPGEVCGAVNDCWWQGCRDLGGDSFPDNSCTLDIGCRKVTEQYNAPGSVLGLQGSCSYTEWLVFDNGDNTTGRPLTINDAPDYTTSVRVVDTPPFGANLFPKAPVGHAPLRLSVGSGDDAGHVLPAEASSNRNGGKIKIRSRDMFSLPVNVTSVTVVAHMAFGPWDLDNQDAALEMRIPSSVPGRHWRFGVIPPNNIPGDGGVEHLAIINRSASTPAFAYPFGPLSVRDYNYQTETWSGGEFYTLHLICRADGTWSAYLNEVPGSLQTGSLGSPGVDDAANELTELQWGLIDGSGGADCAYPEGCGKTIWFDYVKVLEGEVIPTGCSDPVFDVNDDHQLDISDFSFGFLPCASGPNVPSTIWAWCPCMDIDGDDDVDQTDFAAFQRCIGLTGPALEACDD